MGNRDCKMNFKKLPVHRMVAMNHLFERIAEDVEDGVSQVHEKEETPVSSIEFKQHDPLSDIKSVRPVENVRRTTNIMLTPKSLALKNYLQGITKRTQRRIRPNEPLSEREIERAQLKRL